MTYAFANERDGRRVGADAVARSGRRGRRSDGHEGDFRDPIRRFGRIPSDVVPKQETVRVKTHGAVTTAQRHHHLCG